MKKFLSLITLVILLTVGVSGQVGPNDKLAFDFPNENLSAAQITRFELKVDGGEYTSIGLPAATNRDDTPEGNSTYVVAMPALTTGDHTVLVRACNSTGCSTDSAPLTFRLIIIVSPTGVRIIR